MHKILTLGMLFIAITTFSQENLEYQKPSEEILNLIDVQLAPSVMLDDRMEMMVLLYRDAYKTIEELSKEELRLAGLRIDPKKNIGSRVTYYNNVKIKNIEDDVKDPEQVTGLPANPQLTNFSWSPDQKKNSHDPYNGKRSGVMGAGYFNNKGKKTYQSNGKCQYG